MAPKIFLAHAREDKAQVRKLYADLKARGFDPWFDEVDLVGGQVWQIEISKVIDQAGVFLACLSSRSVGKVGFIQSEFRRALWELGERPPGMIFLIPVRLDDCDVPDLQIPNTGLSLRDIHRVDLWQEDGLDLLVRAIEKALEELQRFPAAEAVALPVEGAPDRAPVHIAPRAAPNQKAIEGPPKAAAGEPAQKRTLKERVSPLWRPSIIGTILGLFGVVAAALLLLEHISYGNRRSDPEIQKTPPEERSEEASQPVPMITIPEEPFRDCDDCPLMVAVRAGPFIMGSTEAERQWAIGQGAAPEMVENEKPQHPVQISERFAVGKYEVTFDEWGACVADGGCNGYKPKDNEWGRGRYPVMHVSWEDAQRYVAWLTKKTGIPYRLPSEAEWEYTCRAGTTTRYSWGDSISAEDANYDGNLGKTTEVGSYSPNPWGLHDMHGNVWEWVEDCWNESYQGAPKNGLAWKRGNCNRAVLRGGSWGSKPEDLRSAHRSWGDTKYQVVGRGFRVARTLTP